MPTQGKKLGEVVDMLLQVVKCYFSLILTLIHADTVLNKRNMSKKYCRYTSCKQDESSSMQK